MPITDNTAKWNVKKVGAGTPAEMVGATSSAKGKPGVVPAPSAGDNEKFLCGDGSFKAVDVTKVTGNLPIANGGTGGNTFVKSASISGKNITLNMSDGSNKTLTTQDTVGSDGTVSEKLKVSGTSPANGSITKTVSGLTAYKPIYVLYLAKSGSSVSVSFKNCTNAVFASSAGGNYGEINGTATSVSSGAMLEYTIIPTATTVAVTFKYGTDTHTYDLAVYQ